MFSLQPPRHIPTLPIASVPQFGPSPLLSEPDITVGAGKVAIDPLRKPAVQMLCVAKISYSITSSARSRIDCGTVRPAPWLS